MTVETPEGKIEVEVSEEIYNFNENNKKYMNRVSRKESRHNYSLESALYEGEDYGYYDSYPTDELEELRERNEERNKCRKAFSKLTEAQQRRLKMYAIDGYTYQKIADIEGVNLSSVYESIESAKQKFKKNF